MKEPRVLIGQKSGRIYVDTEYLELEDGTFKLSANAKDVSADAIFAVIKFLEKGNGKFEYDNGDKIYKLKLKTRRKITPKRKNDIEEKNK